VKKDENSISIASHKDLTDDSLEFLKNTDLTYSSILTRVIDKIIERSKNDKQYKASITEKAFADLFFSVNNIGVYLSNADMHNNYLFDKDVLDTLLSSLQALKDKKENWIDYYPAETIISKSSYEEYARDNKKLERFIKVFKPELKEIELEKSEDKDTYHVKRLFKYEKYNVEYEFESSGIKQLVKLFTYLSKCANGGVVFIDEIDVNINAVYFEKLISFFRKYGKGQLVFTTHNIEAMNALKGQSKSILVLGEDNKIDVWVGKGNKSPINDYFGGFFPHSPMNVEDFDFVNIFLGEE
jgi:hypothetical protein